MTWLEHPMPAEHLLVDSRLGPITAIGPHPRLPGVPPGWTGWEAAVGRTEAFTYWRADPSGCGASLGDPARARAAALGEAVERYCGNAVPDSGPLLSFTELRAAGRDATDPTTFALYSDRQYDTPGFPFTRFTRDLPVRWLPGRDLATGAEVHVPASLALLDYHHGTRAAEPAIAPVSYAGIAAGTSRAHAERNAIEELIERDATTIWWAGGGPTYELDGLPGDLLRHRLDDDEHDTRTVRFLHILNAFGVPVVAAFLEDHSRGVVSFGSACRATAAQAAEKALVEAIGLLSMTLQLTDPDSDLLRAHRAGRIPAHTFTAYRADRQYRDSFRDDLRDMIDLPALAQLYLDPRMRAEPLQRLRTGSPISWDQVPPVPDPPETYLQRLGSAGLRAVSVDVTTPDVQAAGLHVVRVLVPGLLGNAPAAYPYRGGTRLYDVPAHLGWSPVSLTEDQLVTTPLPLA